jgi:cytochrome c peroxidase
MHDGSVATLAAVIDHYDQGFVQRPSLDSQMRPLGLTSEEKSDLLAFLESLTSIDPATVVPVLPY